jgi:hypothetical protein
LAQQSNTIKGKFWNKQKVNSALPSLLEIANVDYLVLKTTKEAGSGAVLLFAVLQLLVTDAAAYFAETKMPPDDISSTSGFITSDEQAK